jgi:hypothetical protein
MFAVERPQAVLHCLFHPIGHFGASKFFMSADLEWVRQYRAALNEADGSKRLARIEEAERALKRALRQAIEKGDSDERHRISEALHPLNLLARDKEGSQMPERIERGGCRFHPKRSEGKLEIEMELFHATVPRLASATLSFELLSGIKPEQARDLVEKMTDLIIGIVLTPK